MPAPAASSSPRSAWKIAPVIASETAPESSRFIASTPAAIPALLRGIAAIAALDIGA